MSDHDTRLSDIYHRALERAPDERASFLLGACGGDDGLRHEVESLLACEPASVPFLETPAVAIYNNVPNTNLVGRQFGPYRIISPLGAGGMAEVYRAHDDKLDREVAVKFLPSRFTADPERRARFVREARVLATLNHPHIGAIYGLEEGDGLTALVLELIEGPTLEQLLQSGPLLLKDVVSIARQVADALDAAHGKGIVHRDLKPSNIVVQVPSGADVERRAKVVDFGVAKTVVTAVDDAPALGDDKSSLITAEGRILGTPAYMSPEQARGQLVDKRADIWAFGCVLYEMLTGLRSFEGNSPTDTIARVLEQEPDWSAIPPGTPENLRRLIRRCLDKDPSRRVGDIAQARLELAVEPVAQGAASVTAKRTSRTLMIGLAGFALILLGLVGSLTYRSAKSDPPIQITRLTFDEGLQTNPALSPDGRFVAYASNTAGNFDVYTQPVAGGTPVRVTDHPAHDWQPDWSVNAQIVFRSEREQGGLYVVGPTGGHERRVAAFGGRPLWSPDGTRILFSRYPSLELYTVGLDGATPRACEQCFGGAYGWFEDSSHIAIFSRGPGPQYLPQIRVVNVENGHVETWAAAPAVTDAFRTQNLSVGLATLVWDANAHLFYFEGSSGGTSAIWKLEANPITHRLIGGPDRVATMAEESTGLTVARETGAMAFASAGRIPRLLWLSLDSSGRQITAVPKALTTRELPPSDADVAQDGSRLVFSVMRPDGPTAELRVKVLSESVERPLRVSDTSRGEQRQRPRFSPDGSRIVFRYVLPRSAGANETHSLLRPQQLRLLDVTSGEETELTTPDSTFVTPGTFSADGRYVLAAIDRLQQNVRVMSISLLPLAAAPKSESQMKVITTHKGQDGLLDPVMAPNGRWIAFEVQGKTSRIALVGSSDGQWNESQPESSWRYLDPIAMHDPQWSVDGRRMYFVSTHGGIANVWGSDFDPASGEASAPFQVTKFDGQGEQIPLANAMSAVARTGLVVRTVNRTGSIWYLTPRR